MFHIFHKPFVAFVVLDGELVGQNNKVEARRFIAVEVPTGTQSGA